MKPTEIRDLHQKLREILKSYGNEECGNCIIDEICSAFNYPTTTDLEVDFEHVQEWFYKHDTQWQNSMEEDFYNSDNKEGAKSHIDWAYMRFNEGIFINY